MIRSLLACVFLFLMAMSAWASDGTTVNAGATQSINAHSVCKRVTNYAGASVYVPTTSASEWASFYGAPPSAVSVSACPPTCGGFSHGGFCWYYGGSGQSCTDVCASRGGTTNGVVTHTGSSGTMANCIAVAQGLGVTYSTANDGGIGGGMGFAGCLKYAMWGASMLYRMVEPTTQAAPPADIYRVCSCVQ